MIRVVRERGKEGGGGTCVFRKDHEKKVNSIPIRSQSRMMGIVLLGKLCLFLFDFC